MVRGLLDNQHKHDFVGYLIALLVSAAVGLGVVLAEITVQSGRILDQSDLAWSLSILFGPTLLPGDLRATQAWNAIAAEQGLLENPGYTELLTLSLGIDYAFVAVYFLTGLILVLKICRSWARVVGVAALLALAGGDLAENALAQRVIAGDTDRIGAVLVASDLKWWALLALLVIVVLSIATQGRTTTSSINRASLVTAWRAVMTQRLSLLPTVALFVLSVTAGAPILEQLPDVQRSWIDDGPVNGHALWAVLALVVLTVSVWVTTRRRTAYAERVAEQPWLDAPEPPLGFWLYGPAVALVAAVVTFLFGGASLALNEKVLLERSGPTLYLVRLLIFVLVPSVIVIGSLLLRRLWRDRPVGYRPWTPPRFSDGDVAAVRLIGNVATIAVIVVGGLGLIRAFSPVIILGVSEPLVARSWLWVIIGGLVVIVPWAVPATAALRASLQLKRLDGAESVEAPATTAIEHQPAPKPASARPDPKARRYGHLLFGFWLLIFIVLAWFPGVVADIGLAATATAGIGALTGMVSSVALLMQGYKPAELFRLVHLERSPYITVLVITLVVVSLASGQGTIHGVDPGPRVESRLSRTDLQAAFTEWYGDADGCRIAVNGRTVRPMLLIAAEGGGIRAAYWTVRGLEALGAQTCAGRAALFSSGASGGSVGLTVARFSGSKSDPGITRAVGAVRQMADGRILAGGANGMFVRDTFYGATGVPVPRLAAVEDGWAWSDRARQLEEGWRRAYDRTGPAWGSRSFLGEPADDLSPVTGHLILNSTSAKNNCRVWISQLDLPPNGDVTADDTFDPEYNCDKAKGPGPRTIDLLETYGPLGQGPAGADATRCFHDVRAVTAALLTARFPYVTPGGVVGPCPVVAGSTTAGPPYWPSTQLVDGGYLENSGLATITDLAPEWLPLVRDKNLEVMASGQGELVVPIVVYLANGDPRTTRPRINENPISEISLPLLTYLRGSRSLSEPDALLERARDLVQIDGFCPGSMTLVEGAAEICRGLDAYFDRRVIVVDRLPTPEVSAPLGWALSESTHATLENAIADQLGADCDSKPVPSCAADYAPLGQLRRYFGAAPPT